MCQNSPPRPVHLGWPYMARLIVSLHSRFCICPPRGYFPVLCKFWRLCGGVDGDLPQEGSWHTQACCTRAPASAAAAQSPCHCWPGPPQEVLKHSSGLVSGVPDCIHSLSHIHYTRALSMGAGASWDQFPQTKGQLDVSSSQGPLFLTALKLSFVP